MNETNLIASKTRDFIRLSIIENERLMNNEISKTLSPIYEECKEMKSYADELGVSAYKIMGYMENVELMGKKEKEIKEKYLHN